MADDWGVLAEAERLLAQQQYQRLVELLSPWLSGHPEQARFWELLAAAHFGLRQWAEAEATAAQVVRLEPASARARCNWGIALRKTMQFEQARRAQYGALAIDPAYAQAQRELEKIERDEGQPRPVAPQGCQPALAADTDSPTSPPIAFEAQKVRDRPWPAIVIVAAVVVVLLIAVVCGLFALPRRPTPVNQVATPVPQPQVAQWVPPPEYILLEWDIQQPPTPSGPLRDEPPSDWKYMRVNAWARVTNHTSRIITVDSEKFGLQGPGLHDDTQSSLSYGPFPVAHLLNPRAPEWQRGLPWSPEYAPFTVGDLTPGQSVDGGLIFEVPDYQRPPLRLEYDADPLDFIGRDRKYRIVERNRSTGEQVTHP